MHTMCLHLPDSAAHREWHSVITLLHACDRGAFMPAVWLTLTFPCGRIAVWTHLVDLAG